MKKRRPSCYLKETASNGLTRDIVTASVLAKNIRIGQEAGCEGDNRPGHRVHAVRFETGAAWAGQDKEGGDYLSLKPDDPASHSGSRQPV